MSVTSLENALHDVGVSLDKLQALAPDNGEPLPEGPTLPAAAVDDSIAANVAELVTDFNALLTSLRNAGILAPST